MPLVEGGDSNLRFGVSPSVRLIWFNLHDFHQEFVLCCRCSDAVERVMILAKKQTWF